MGLKPQVGKYRASFSLSEVQELVTAIDLAYPQGLSSNQIELYNVYRKLKSQLVLANEGLISPDYVTKPRDTLVDRLGFSESVPISIKQTPTATEEDEIIRKIQIIEEENKKILEAGGKLPELGNLLLDPSFNFSKD